MKLARAAAAAVLVVGVVGAAGLVRANQDSSTTVVPASDEAAVITRSVRPADAAPDIASSPVKPFQSIEERQNYVATHLDEMREQSIAAEALESGQ